MEKVWLKNYQEGVPAEINPDAYPSLSEMFVTTCQKYGKLPAFAHLRDGLSYTQMEELTRYFAAFCIEELHLHKGDKIAIIMPNILQYPIALFGALRAGLVVVNVNPLFTPREFRNQLADSQCKCAIILENFAHTLEKVWDDTAIKHVIVTQIGDCFSPLKGALVNWTVKYIKRMIPAWSIRGHYKFKCIMKLGKKLPFNPPAIQNLDIAFLQYTGATTGLARGAILTHRNMIADLMQADAWAKPVIKEAKEIVVTALPLYHIFSLMANCLLFFLNGGMNLLIANPRDMKSFVKEIKPYRFTVITGVNTLFNALLHQPAFAKLDFSALHISLGGGMAVQRVVAEQWKKVTGTPLLEAYGLTEACPAVCINPFYLKDFNGTIGLPVPSTDISIRDEYDRELSFNEAGELCVKGPQVMQGYWQLPKETQESLRNGWLYTGDIATIDKQGFVRIVDRKKDMIVVSGFNVYPTEVEEIISGLNGVAEVAVIGVPREEGERVKAFIVKRHPALTTQQIIDHCREQLAGYKIPKEIEFRDELPKTNVGKILRRALKETSHNIEIRD